jgi:hypothetical protein
MIFRNPNLYDVRLPHYTVNLDCDEVSEGTVSTDPSSPGYPFVSTLAGFVDLKPEGTGNTVCNLAAGYEDVARVETCANTYKFRREWTIYDWCRPGTTVIYHQLIKVGDWTAPTWPAATEASKASLVTHTTSPVECTGTITVQAPTATDNCGTVSYEAWVYLGAKSTINEVAYSKTFPFNVVATKPGTDYTVVWVAKDECGNVSSELSTTERYTDNIAPSCVIDDLRSITLTNYGIVGSQTGIDDTASIGQAWVTADRLNEGSWDNCGSIDEVLVSRMTATGMSTPAPAVSFVVLPNYPTNVVQS